MTCSHDPTYTCNVCAPVHGPTNARDVYGEPACLGTSVIPEQRALCLEAAAKLLREVVRVLEQGGEHRLCARAADLAQDVRTLMKEIAW